MQCRIGSQQHPIFHATLRALAADPNTLQLAEKLIAALDAFEADMTMGQWLRGSGDRAIYAIGDRMQRHPVPAIFALVECDGVAVISAEVIHSAQMSSDNWVLRYDHLLTDIEARLNI